MANKTNTAAQNDNQGIRIISTEPRAGSDGGLWVSGEINEFTFKALMFREHTADPSAELERSHISTLGIRQKIDAEIVFNWDRGPDIRASTKALRAAVRTLCDSLAAMVFGNDGGMPAGKALQLTYNKWD